MPRWFGLAGDAMGIWCADLWGKMCAVLGAVIARPPAESETGEAMRGAWAQGTGRPQERKRPGRPEQIPRLSVGVLCFRCLAHKQMDDAAVPVEEAALRVLFCFVLLGVVVRGPGNKEPGEPREGRGNKWPCDASTAGGEEERGISAS